MVGKCSVLPLAREVGWNETSYTLCFLGSSMGPGAGDTESLEHFHTYTQHCKFLYPLLNRPVC
jgi:hypothetical protein